MAPESSEPSGELDIFIPTPLTNSARRPNDLYNDFDFFDSSFNHSSGFNSSTHDGFGSAESAFSNPYTSSSLGHSAPMPSQAEDMVGWSNSHLQLQDHQEHLGDGDVSEEMEGISYDLNISNSSLSPPRDSFLPYNNWNPSAEHGNYTLNPVWPAGSHHNNNISQPQQVTYGLENSISNEFSNQVPWNAEDRFVPVSQFPVYSFGQEAIVQRQILTPLIEDQNVPRFTITYPNLVPRNVNPIEFPNISAQEKTPQYPKPLNICEPFSLDVRPGLLRPVANADLSANYPNTAPPVRDILWPSDPIVTSSYENSPSTTAQLMPTLHSSSEFSEMSENRSVITSVTNPVHSRRRKNMPIRQAPAKMYPGTLHVSTNMTRREQVYGPQEAQPKHSDRRGLTKQEKKNAKEVREIGACVVCAMKKLKCDNKEICEACQTMAKAKHPKLVPRHICLPRGGILVFRQGIPDFFYTNTRVGNPLNLPSRLQGSWRTITIGDRVSANNVIFPKKVPLIVRVREYETYDLDAALVWSEGSRKSAVTSYTIDPSTLPTALKLEEWGRNLFLEASEVPDFRPYIMDKFLFAYWNAKPYLRYHHLVDLTIRLVALSTWLYESHPITSVENVNNQNLPLFRIRDDRIERRLSGVARSQLLLIAAKEFEAAEEKILYLIDSLMRSPSCSPQNAVIPGLCLRRMAVLYRTAFKRYKKFVNDSWMLQKAEKPKAMYEALTTAYSLIYSGAKNAFSIEWRAEDCLGAFGNDRELSNLFVKVMNYDREYCQKNLNDEDDVHLKILFLERKKGGGPRSR